MNSNTREQIKYIIKKFNDDKNIQPKLWNIDTPVIAMLKRFRENLIKNDLCNFNYLSLVKLETKNSNDNDQYQMHVNGINITPVSRGNGSVAWSTARQYLQFFSSFGWVFFNERDKKNKIANNIITNFDVSSSISSLTSKEVNMNSLLINLIINGSRSYVNHTRNLAYSLFVYYCYNNDYRFTDDLRIMFTKIKAKDNIKTFFSDDKYSEHYILGEKIGTKHKGNLSETFKTCLDELNIRSFEENINDIYLAISDKDNEEKFRFVSVEAQIMNFINKCENSRGKLRKNIIEQRVIDENNHSDIEALDNSIKLERSISAMQASHIYEIWSIKSIAREVIQNKELENSLYEDCINPNNGILLPRDYHFYFDKGGISLNSSGEFIFRSEFIEEFEKIGIVPCKIKDEYFNEEMKNYIERRM